MTNSSSRRNRAISSALAGSLDVKAPGPVCARFDNSLRQIAVHVCLFLYFRSFPRSRSHLRALTSVRNPSRLCSCRSPLQHSPALGLVGLIIWPSKAHRGVTRAANRSKARRRQPRSFSEHPREHARSLVGQTPRATHRTGSLSAAAAGPAAGLARCRRHAALFYSGRHARAPTNGCDHRRRTAPLSAIDRSLP